MREYGFEPEMPPEVASQLAQLAHEAPGVAAGGDIRDLRDLPWSSIDNDTSRDLDQLEVAASRPDGAIEVRVAVADVDAFVPKDSPIDRHAAVQTTTVYTGLRNFPMLPEVLSTGLTSLQEGADKLAVVVEYVVSDAGQVQSSAVYRAVVRNTAQLAYDSVGGWLENRGPMPPKVAASRVLQAQLQLQNTAAQALRRERHQHGALNIETIETRPILADGNVVGLARQEKNPATELIEDFMIASNEVVARLLESHQVASIRRVVKTPKRWDRIVELAAARGERLPAAPDAPALNRFLLRQKQKDPEHFPDLSLAVVKLMGSGEYVLERPGEQGAGHFGLAIQDYTHSTAPNRRFADLVTQRVLKANIAGQPSPYRDEELSAIAAACTAKEDAARKVERAMSKRIAAVALSGQIGALFDAIVTGVTPSGTFVRIVNPHVEGLLAQGKQGVDVGDSVRVRLVRTDPSRGYIDFARA
jgi:VacB/RNase II family 3'-5' exoribonuclease